MCVHYIGPFLLGIWGMVFRKLQSLEETNKWKMSGIFSSCFTWMHVACQVFGKLPLWGIQLDYWTFSCDNCYMRLWVAFLLCYLATLLLNELITLSLLYLGWWSFSYYTKSIIKLVVFFFLVWNCDITF